MKIIITVIGWLISYFLLIGIAGPIFSTCTQYDSDAWLASLISYGPIGIIGLLILVFGRKLSRVFCFFALPHILTIGLAVKFIPFYFLETTVKGLHVCTAREGWPESDIMSTPLWQKLWAPIWTVYILCLIGVFILHWFSHSE
jgi:hypothetical protein